MVTNNILIGLNRDPIAEPQYFWVCLRAAAAFFSPLTCLFKRMTPFSRFTLLEWLLPPFPALVIDDWGCILRLLLFEPLLEIVCFLFISTARLDGSTELSLIPLVSIAVQMTPDIRFLLALFGGWIRAWLNRLSPWPNYTELLLASSNVMNLVGFLRKWSFLSRIVWVIYG